MAHKQRFRSDVQRQFDILGTPEVFATWSVDLGGPAFVGVFNAMREIVYDVPLFCLTYQREWNRIWSFMRGRLADVLLGGLRGWAFVVEYQNRGAPHVHCVLWTKRTLNELIEQNNQGGRLTIVSCDANPTDVDLRETVQRVQIHGHTENYCVRTRHDGGKYCRFMFPKPVSDCTRVVDNEVLYRRGEGDVMVNPYCPDLTRFCRSNTDFRLNVGPSAHLYISKYISKSEDKAEGSLKESGTCCFFGLGCILPHDILKTVNSTYKFQQQPFHNDLFCIVLYYVQ